MKNLFSLDNPVMRFLDQMADLIILNLLFIVCSIPLITLGASATAMCYVTLKMRDGEEGSVFRNFFKAFRQNFAQATLIWIILAALAGFLLADHFLIRDLEGTGYQVIRILLPLCAILWGMVTLYVFFIQARFTHCAPTSIAQRMRRHGQPDKLTDFLEMVRQRCRFSKWFCGHYHVNQVIDERFVIQWEQISQIV